MTDPIASITNGLNSAIEYVIPVFRVIGGAAAVIFGIDIGHDFLTAFETDWESTLGLATSVYVLAHK
jgi:hypothetical protein